ncbi:hypothetical protein BBJ28_00001694 [Nothophytophthora sp. Chile5]|nr:hypothetical protein BBJ28_00001694 [Nothophytophthora sp. Chile5]
MRVPTPFAVVAALALLASGSANAAVESRSDPSTDSELVLLISLSRHGSRAPNPSAKVHCPNNKANMESYSVPLEQLTERGMQQLEKTGRHIREVYVNEKGFLSPSFNGPEDEPHFEAYFRADAANRCGQSAVSLGYGLYPKGTGPAGFEKQPIPVYMQLFENEHDFTANGPCWGVMQEANKKYAAGHAATLIEEHKESLTAIADICGHNFFAGGDPVTAIKDVNDMFLFDQDEGLDPTPGLTPELTNDITQLAFEHLIERLYSTPRQITTAIGGFPQLLVRNLNEGAAPIRSPESIKYLSYHGHRELMHGLGFMMGMKFNFEGLPEFNGSTPLHPGTTLFFELHRSPIKSDSTTNPSSAPPTYEYFVQLFVWSPLSPRTAVKLDNCEMNCPLAEFTAIIDSHIQATGAWQDICNYHPVNVPVKSVNVAVKDATIIESKSLKQDPALLEESADSQEVALFSGMRTLWLLLAAGGFAAMGAVGATTYHQFMERRGYQSL